MRKSIIMCLLLSIVFAIGCTQTPKELTQKEKADIQYQLYLMSKKATHNAVEIKYETEGDGIEDIRLKDSYKSICKQFEGITAPSEDVNFSEFIVYGMKINDTTNVELSFEDGSGWGYYIKSKYDFKTHTFENSNEIFTYMCATKGEYEGVENDTWLWNVQLENIFNKIKKGGAE